MRNLYHLLNAATEGMLVEVAPTYVYGLCYQQAHGCCQSNSIGENKIIRYQNEGKEGEFSPALTVPAPLTMMEEMLVAVVSGSVCRPGYLQGHTAI